MTVWVPEEQVQQSYVKLNVTRLSRELQGTNTGGGTGGNVAGGGGEFNPLCRTLARTAWLTASTMAALLLHMQLSSEWLTSCIAVTEGHHWPTVLVSHCFWCRGKISKQKCQVWNENWRYEIWFVITRRSEIWRKKWDLKFSQLI